MGDEGVQQVIEEGVKEKKKGIPVHSHDTVHTASIAQVKDLEPTLQNVLPVSLLEASPWG